MRQIKVLIVDDSIVFRKILEKGVGIDSRIQVVATAGDPFEARDMILKYDPDVVTCDIEMPKMNGIEFVKRLIPQHPIPVIVVSSISEKVFEAMDAGAVDFITKPNAQSPDDVQKFILHLVEKIKEVAFAKVSAGKKTEDNRSTAKSISHHKLIAIGASTGGTEAIFNVLKQLPKGLPGITIVQHIPPVFSDMFAKRLDNQTHFSVKEARHGDIIKPDHVYLAPGDKHIQVVSSGDDLMIKCFAGDKVNGHCPSVDVMFTSVAKTVGSKAIGVILTGMGYDGAKGLAMMKRKGATTIGQDEATCVVYGMPKAAKDIGGVMKQAPLDHIGVYITRSLK